MKVVILCGGLGTRLREETEFKPKPMVEIGGRPILWHIMKIYASYGFKEFVLCLGYKGDIIRDFFHNYEMRTSDATITLGSERSVEFHDYSSENNWKVTLAETGEHAMTGARIKRIAKYLQGQPFMLTYGDGVADIDIGKLLSFHRSHGRIATVTGVTPPSRFGEMSRKGSRVVEFLEKRKSKQATISGGFFVFEPRFLHFLNNQDSCVLEKTPLARLAKSGDLRVYRHKGFWQCMDTYREAQLLNRLWEGGKAPWKVWKDEKNSPSQTRNRA